MLVLPDSSRVATCGIITYEDAQTLDALPKAHGARPEIVSVNCDVAKRYATLVHIPPYTSVAQPHKRGVGDFARLGTTQVEPAQTDVGGTNFGYAGVETRSNPPHKDYTVFAHVTGPTNPANGSTVWAQADGQPGGGTYPTTQWQTGQTVIESYGLALPPSCRREQTPCKNGNVFA